MHRSLISHGCQISGTVEHSVLSPGVRVDPGAIVRDSVIMFDTHIRAGAVVDRAILDKEVNVGPNAIVGTGNDSIFGRGEIAGIDGGIRITYDTSFGDDRAGIVILFYGTGTGVKVGKITDPGAGPTTVRRRHLV